MCDIRRSATSGEDVGDEIVNVLVEVDDEMDDETSRELEACFLQETPATSTFLMKFLPSSSGRS